MSTFTQYYTLADNLKAHFAENEEFKKLPKLTHPTSSGLALRGNNLSRCCGIYEISTNAELYEGVEYYKFILDNREEIMVDMLTTFVKDYLGTGGKPAKSNYRREGDYIGPTMFVMTDYVPSRALYTKTQWNKDIQAAYKKDSTRKNSNYHENMNSLVGEYFKPFYLAKCISDNPFLGSLVRGGNYRSNGNYRRYKQGLDKEILETSTLKMPTNISGRHILNCWIWQPNLDLIEKPTFKVFEYPSLKATQEIYNVAPPSKSEWATATTKALKIARAG